jgi:hypothetical protein
VAWRVQLGNLGWLAGLHSASDSQVRAERSSFSVLVVTLSTLSIKYLHCELSCRIANYVRTITFNTFNFLLIS